MLSDSILQGIPNSKYGIIYYKNIVIDESPKMLQGRLEFFQEKIKTDLLHQSVLDYPGVKEWHRLFKNIGVDPHRYRPSHEALFRRIEKGKALPFIHSAADLNNFFSLQYEIPIGIYDYDTLRDYIKISIGTEDDTFEGLNGRQNNMQGKMFTTDKTGAFGSPVVDSARTKTTERTKNALQIFYLRPSMGVQESEQLLYAAAKMFTQLHSGNASVSIVHSSAPKRTIS
ncbi:B3/B4 domain-containing protein [Alteribacillus persepolensis]|nr:phenylalanine--tRNA ligase beta subunit-related protein [Alteribacillus persepolensis]